VVSHLRHGDEGKKKDARVAFSCSCPKSLYSLFFFSGASTAVLSELGVPAADEPFSAFSLMNDAITTIGRREEDAGGERSGGWK